MPRFSVFAVGVSLIAFSTLAFAGSDNATNGGSALSRAASEGGVKSAPSISRAPSAGGVTPSAGQSLVLAAPTDIDAVPILKHIASTGAQLLDLGAAHGLRSVSARSGEQFMILQIAPDGQAVVGGPQLDLPVDKLMTLASGQVKDLGETHGLRGLYLRNGQRVSGALCHAGREGDDRRGDVGRDRQESDPRAGVEDRRRDSDHRCRQGWGRSRSKRPRRPMRFSASSTRPLASSAIRPRRGCG